MKNVEAPSEPLNLDPHHITVEQALKTLNVTMAQLYGGTRAVTKNYTVQTLKGRAFGAKTRSGEALPEDVLYLVNFENEDGYAVLAADSDGYYINNLFTDRLSEYRELDTYGYQDFILIQNIQIMEIK